MDIPPSLVAQRLKVGGITIATLTIWILGGALPLPKPWRTTALLTAFASSIAGVVSSKRLVLEESFYQARLLTSTEAFQSELAYQTAALEQALEAEYFPPEPQNVLEPETAEPTGTLQVQSSEPPANLAGTLAEPPAIADPFATEIDPSIRGLVVMMRRANMTQDETIFKVWGVRKGGSDRYKAALTKYKQILIDAGLA